MEVSLNTKISLNIKLSLNTKMSLNIKIPFNIKTELCNHTSNHTSIIQYHLSNHTSIIQKFKYFITKFYFQQKPFRR